MALYRFTPLFALIPAIFGAWFFGDKDPWKSSILGVCLYVIYLGWWVKETRRVNGMQDALDRLPVETVAVEGHEVVFHWERWFSGVRGHKKYPHERNVYLLGNTLILGPPRWATHIHPLQSTRTPDIKHAIQAHVMEVKEGDQTVIIEARLARRRFLERMPHIHGQEVGPDKRMTITIHMRDDQQRTRLVRTLSSPVPV